MSNPFKKITENSERTKKEWEGTKKVSKTYSKSCECCGAPRPKNTNLTACNYCSFKFMDIENEIKLDL